MTWVQELRAAIGGLTPIPVGAPAPTEADRSGGLAFYPAVGLLLGIAASAVGAIGMRVVGQPWAGVAAVVALELVGRGGGRRGIATAVALLQPGDVEVRRAAVRDSPTPAGWLAALIAAAVKATAAARMPAAGLTAACLLAPLLGRWAMVVEAHGGRSDLARGAAIGIVGGAGFREFGAASVFTFMVLMGFGQAIGLLLLLATALATLGWRVVVHRRLGGFTGRLLAATAEGVETLVFALLASLPTLGA